MALVQWCCGSVLFISSMGGEQRKAELEFWLSMDMTRILKLVVL